MKGVIMDQFTTFQDAVETTEGTRKDFFRLIFADGQGYVCIAYKSPLDTSMTEEYWEYPRQLDEMCDRISERAKTLVHVYFCPQLLKTKKRQKGYVADCRALWADLDTCNPQLLQVPPSVVVQSSQGRWQAFWRLQFSLPPLEAEAICRKIAYFHASQGADKSGWDLTQLMRVPYTPNYKYGDLGTAPLVVVVSTNLALYRPGDFSSYPEYSALTQASSPIPDGTDLPEEDPIAILQRYRMTLNPMAFGLYSLRPEGEEDWSASLWKLEKFCVEAGMSLAEVFVIARAAACNKYKRDRRSDGELWLEIQKAFIKDVEEHNLAPTPTAVIPEILTEEETRLVQGRETFVERYIKWALGITDAAPQYHQAGAFIMLSSVISGTVRLPTSFGTVMPNMWFMLLADTTLTRKTTAMRIATDLLKTVNPDTVMATDGSAEGILTALSKREREPSVYLRDEFTGLLELISHRDYMAGFAEHLTKLYDGETIKRILRKEEIRVDEPIFIIYAGGIKSKTQMLLTDEHINSGFVPRFVFITAEPDPARVRPIGPPRPIDTEDRARVRAELFDIYDFYNRKRLIVMDDGSEGYIKPEFKAQLTPAAWERYNEFETVMTKAALETGLWHLTAVNDRLAKSTLKAAILIAASRQRENSGVTVELEDILHAMYYAKFWHAYSSEVVNGVGKSNDERLLDQIMLFIARSGQMGVTRAEIMRKFALDSKKAELIFSTIMQRRLVFVTQYKGQPRYIGAA
jgi:hypothetical protein